MRTAMLYTRLINILSHGNYSLYEPQEMMDENKRYFRKDPARFHQPTIPSILPCSRESRREQGDAT